MVSIPGPVESQSQSQDSQKNFWKIGFFLLLIIFIVISGVFGYYLFFARTRQYRLAMTIPSPTPVQDICSSLTREAKLRDGVRKAHLESEIKPALEMHRADKGVYPDSLSSLKPGYLAIIPEDPLSIHGYKYEYKSIGNNYVLCSYIEFNNGVNYDGDCGGTCGEIGHCYYKVTAP